jgi:hypothetical protein
MKPTVPKHRRMKASGKSPTHLDLVRQLPCLLSGRPAEAAHIRFADAKYDKTETGAGRKPDDKWVLPLCPELHRLVKGCQHDSDERAWWLQFGIDPLEVAQRLWGRNRLQMLDVITMKTPWHQRYRDRVKQILKGEGQ